MRGAGCYESYGGRLGRGLSHWGVWLVRAGGIGWRLPLLLALMGASADTGMGSGGWGDAAESGGGVRRGASAVASDYAAHNGSKRDTTERMASGIPNGHLVRRLQGSFSPASLNQILRKVKLDVCAIPGACFEWPTTIPDTPGHDLTILGSKVDISYWHVYCDSLEVGSLSVTTSQVNDHTVRMALSLENILIKCGLGPDGPIQWKADYIITPHGTATGESLPWHHNKLSLHVDISSEGTSFASSLPSLSGIDVSCSATHSDASGFDLDFHVYGSHLSGHLVELLRSTIKDAVLKALTQGGSNSVVCKQIGSIIPGLLTDVLGEVNDELEPYMQFLSEEGHAAADAMATERQLLLDIVAGRVSPLVNLQTDPVVSLAMTALRKVGDINTLLPQLLPVLLPHATLTNGTLTTRDFLGLLGSNSTIVVGGSGAVEMEIHVNEIRVGGLNTFTRFDLLELLGQYTASSAMYLEHLSLEVDVDLTVKPNGDIGPIAVTNHDPILESLTVRSYVNRPAMEVAATMALKKSVYDTSLGDMLLNPVRCVLGQVFTSNVTKVNATIGDIAHPTIQGFSHADLGVIFDDISNVCFLLYEHIGETLLPWITQTQVRKTLNELQMLFVDGEHGSCPHHEQAPQLTFVDFRSLMFQSVNLTHQLRALLDEVTVHDINSGIGSLTKESSGIAGVYTYSHMWNDSTVLKSFPEKQNDWIVAHPGKQLADAPAYLRGPGVCMTCSKIGEIEIGIGNLSISGLNSVGGFDILRPIGPYGLANRVNVSSAQFSFDVLFRVKGDAINIDDSFSVHLNVTNVTLSLDIVAKIDENRFLNLGIRHLADLRYLATTLAALRAATADLHFQTARVTIDCDAPKKCTSPMLVQMATNLIQTQSTLSGISGVTSTINGFFQRVLNAATTDPNAMRQLNLTVAHYADVVDATNLMSTEIARQIRDSQNGTCNDYDGPMCRVWQSQRQCEENPRYMLHHCRESCDVCRQPVVDEVPFSVQGFGAVVLLVAGICGALMWCSLRQERDVKARGHEHSEQYALAIRERTLSKEMRLLDDPDSMNHAESGYVKLDPDEVEAEKTDPAACQYVSLLHDHQHLRMWQRYGVPAALVLNILVFAFGHWHLGAQVDIDCHLAGDSLRLDRFVEFSLGHSLVDMYNAGTWALLIMVGTFSGIWPYTKLLAMLYCWCAKPGSCFTKFRRVQILAAMDYAGTWSLIDLYVLAMFILAFRLHAASPAVAYVPEKFYSFDVFVTPVAGLYGFIVGVCLSIVMNYAVLTLSRKTLQTDGDREVYTPCRAMPPDKPGSLKRRLTLRAVLQKQERCQCRTIECVATETRGLVILAVVSIVMTCVGANRPAFKITVYGMIGAMVDLGNPGSSIHVFSLANSTSFIGAQSDLDEFAGPAGVWFIAAIYGSFCIIVPLAVLCVSCVQLLCPMTLREQKNVALVCEALRAWSALEVFIVAVYVTTLQLSEVSNMILADACHHELSSFVNGVVNPMIQFGIIDVSLFDLDPRANECFIMEAVHQDGIYVLIVAAALSSFTVRWSSLLVERAIKARFENPRLFDAADAVSDNGSELPSPSRTSTVELEMQEPGKLLVAHPQAEPQPEPQAELQLEPQPRMISPQNAKMVAGGDVSKPQQQQVPGILRPSKP